MTIFLGPAPVRDPPRVDRLVSADVVERPTRQTPLQRRNRIRGSAGEAFRTSFVRYPEANLSWETNIL